MDFHRIREARLERAMAVIEFVTLLLLILVWWAAS